MERGRGSTDRHPFFPPPSRPRPRAAQGAHLVWFLLYRHLKMAHIGGKEGSCHRPVFWAVTSFLSPPRLVVWRGRLRRGKLIHKRQKERDLPLPSSHVLSPSRKSGTPELELSTVPPNYIQASPGPPVHPCSPGPASGTRRVGGCWQTQ